MPLRPRRSLALQLCTDRQASNAFAGRRKDGVAQRRSEWRHARLTYAAGRLIAVDDVHMRLAWRHVHARHLEIVEVALLYPSIAERDLSIEGRAQGHHCRAFHLRSRSAMDGYSKATSTISRWRA